LWLGEVVALLLSKVAAQNAGAIAVIVVNSEPNNIIMSGADATIMIPQLASVAALVSIISQIKME
jgi:hypothetical protein